MRRLSVRALGLVEYEDGLALQHAIEARRLAGEGEDTLLLLEHPRVITLGRAAKETNLLVPRDELSRRGVQIHETDRGGDVTYHGPGQLVGYPVLDLKPDRQDVRRWVRDVEEILIRTVKEFGVEAGRIPRWTGVWVGGEEDPHAAKIAAIGVHLRKWVTTHGFALNVATDLSDFDLIVPCGIRERGVTSLSRELGRPVAIAEVLPHVARAAGDVLGAELDLRGPDAETVSVCVARPGRSGPEVLVLRRTPERGGFPQIVTGRIEPGESPPAAAARELAEETGLSVPLEPLEYVHAFGLGEGPGILREHAFAAWAPAGAQVRLDPGEHAEAAWLPAGEAARVMPFAGLRVAVERTERKAAAAPGAW